MKVLSSKEWKYDSVSEKGFVFLNTKYGNEYYICQRMALDYGHTRIYFEVSEGKFKIRVPKKVGTSSLLSLFNNISQGLVETENSYYLEVS